MGNRITRISRRAFKNKKKKSKNKSGRTIKEPECQCSTFPVTGSTPICMNCESGFMQEVETNRLNGKYSIYSGHWGIIENSALPNCGAQFDAKKFDKIFKLNTTRSQQFDESENDDSQFGDELSDSFQSETSSEISKKRRESMMQDDDNSSYSSIFAVFERLEYNALLSSTALDEMFFYPAITEATDCDELTQSMKSKQFPSQSATIDKKLFDETKQFDDTLFDETHLYDTVASSGEEFDVIIWQGSKNTSLRARQLKSFKPDDLKLRDKKYKIRKSKKLFNAKHKPIPFNATQFDAKQIDNTEFDGILFNDSQFDAKYFDATQLDVRPFFVTQPEKSQISSSKIDSALQLNEIRSFKESQFNASEFKALQSNGIKLNDAAVTENQCNDAKFFSTPLNAEKSDVTEFEAALIRTAQFVASHFGTGGLNDTHWGAKDFIAAPFRTTQFNASQFDAKQFDVSQFSFDVEQFTASQFDAKAFADAQKCKILQINSSDASRFNRSQIFHDNCFNASQFDAKAFNVRQFDSRRVYAT